MTASSRHPLTATDLPGPWTVAVDPDGPTPVPAEAAPLVGRRIPARVPGGVLDDLHRAGLIPDPHVDRNEFGVTWVSRTDWVMRAAIPPPAPAEKTERTEIVFDGIDTAARVDVAGRTVGHAANMFRRHRFDITGLVDRAGTDLAVHLTSPYTAAEALRARLGPRPGAYPEPFNFIRKMACSFGWDWGPTLPGAGIWRPVRLERWSAARVDGVRVSTDVDGATGILQAHLTVRRAASGAGEALTVEMLLDGAPLATATLPPGAMSAELRAHLPDVRRWSPVGYGAPERYDCEIRLRAADLSLLDSRRRSVGFRQLALDRSADDAGTRFAVHLDGEPVLVKGINWIPGDLVPGRMTRDRYRRLLQRARDAHVNLIRVWGGGLYETDEFYDLCDEMGLMVWQDFPFACAAYPEEEPLRGEILAEARENVARLAAHPSLVVWNGNNENLWLRGVERWAERPGGESTWGERYYFHDLPAIVAEIDPTRPYTPGSPWSGTWDDDPNDVRHQTHHSWDVWNTLDYVHYRDSAPRFVAEFGWQAPAAWRTLRDAISDAEPTVTSPNLLHHQKAAGGMDKLARGLAAHGFEPHSIEAWHYLTQLTQARAVETAVRHWRAHYPHTAGMILWQLSDVWPALSWSVIDCAGRAKPAYHALRESYAPRILTFDTGGDGIVLCAANDTAEPWSGDAIVRRVTVTGYDAARQSLPVAVAPRSVARVRLGPEVGHFTDPAGQVLVADLGGERAWSYAGDPAQAAPGGPPPQIAVIPTGQGLTITVTAQGLLRDLLVQADRIHPAAEADRGFVTLLPGETATITVRCPEPLDAGAAGAPWTVCWLDTVIGE